MASMSSLMASMATPAKPQGWAQAGSQPDPSQASVQQVLGSTDAKPGKSDSQTWPKQGPGSQAQAQAGSLGVEPSQPGLAP